MSEFKGTPGPWTARKVGGSGYPGQSGFAIDYNVDEEQVADFVYEEADAYLIAAAPELLEALELAHKELHACQAVIHCAGGFDPAYVRDAQVALKRIDAAIAKAKGQPV